MANLGSTNTDADAQSLNLPSGYTIDEDSGDLVIRDTGGTVTLRRTDGGAWSLENNDLNSVGTASVTALEADNLNSADLANATAGTVLVAQGDGTFTMDVAVDDSGSVLGGVIADGASESVAVSSDSEVETDNKGQVAIGSAKTDGRGAVGIGESASADGIAIGREAVADNGGVVLGAFGSATKSYSIVIGKGSATNENEAILGGSDQFSTNSWTVPGDFTVNGSKNFEIDHPAKSDTHDLRHGNYEGDVAGGLIYRRPVSVTTDGDTGTATIQMPDWFGPLATDVDVMCQAEGHFGDAYAERDETTGTEITVTANADGEYKLVIFATRDDANVPNPEDHSVTKPKGERWDGSPQAYYRDAPDVDVSQHDGVGRVEQFFDHGEKCDSTPCESAFENWRITFDDGEWVDVDEPMNADIETIVSKARDDQS